MTRLSSAMPNDLQCLKALILKGKFLDSSFLDNKPHRLKSGLWTLDCTLFMFCTKKCEGTRYGGKGCRCRIFDVVKYRIYVFPLISITFFVFLTSFSNIV